MRCVLARLVTYSDDDTSALVARDEREGRLDIPIAINSMNISMAYT